MRWLLLKDLQILRRSPLLVSLLVIYPIVLSVLIGLALSAGPDKPKVAFSSDPCSIARFAAAISALARVALSAVARLIGSSRAASNHRSPSLR